MDSSSTLSRRESCIEWRCLTSSQKFGVIFSIVVFFLFFSIIFMFYLGRAKLSYESQKSCGPKLRSANVMAQRVSPPEIVPSTPYTAFLPCTFTVHGEPIPIYHPNPALSPRAAIWPQHPAIPASNFPVPVAYAAPPEHHFYPHEPTGAIPSVLPSTFNNVQHQSQYTAPPAPPAPIPVPAAHTERMSPSWFQKVQRAFRIPPGRASTVASRSPSVASRRLDTEAAVTQAEQPMCAVRSEAHGAQGRTVSRLSPQTTGV